MKTSLKIGLVALATFGLGCSQPALIDRTQPNYVKKSDLLDGAWTGEQVLAMVNGMGGTPLIELYVVFNALQRILSGKRITVVRSLVGNYVTSLETSGCSITLVRLDDELIKYWDAPVRTPALRWGM